MDENEKQLNSNSDIKVLRTYTSDMAEAVRKNEMSVIKIAMAEKEKKERDSMYEQVDTTSSPKKIFVIGGIILIIVISVTSFFLFRNKKDVQEEKTIDEVKIETEIMNAVISYDTKVSLDLTKINSSLGLSKTIKEENQISSGLIKALSLEKKINNLTEVLTSKDFISLAGMRMPDTLERSLSEKYLLGKYLTPNNDPKIFLILETSDYPRTYSSMFEWEKTMFQDLFLLFNLPKQDNLTFINQWKDVMVESKDARVLYGDNGEELLYYIFVNKNNLVITSDLNALKEVTTRLMTKNAKSF